ncbi:MAG: hypothetical protein LBQ54_11305 [Planctomycetaceae bacterium]|nr:hypothetical protein [Planctomycetaceae bacterium]
MPPAANARALDPGWSCRSESHEPAPVSRWNQQAEQRGILPEQSEKDNNRSRPRSRAAVGRCTPDGTTVPRAMNPLLLVAGVNRRNKRKVVGKIIHRKPNGTQ